MAYTHGSPSKVNPAARMMHINLSLFVFFPADDKNYLREKLEHGGECASHHSAGHHWIQVVKPVSIS